MREEYFTRQYALWGEEAQERLKTKRIAIIGCGGLGSTLAITLGSSGIGEIHLVDFDTVSIHNIHRQIAFRLGDEGKYKAEVVGELVSSRYDGVNVKVYTAGFEEFAKQNIEIDLLVDATDNLPTRAALEEYAKMRNIPWIYASVEAWHGQVCLFERAEYAKSMVINDRKPEGIAPPIVAFIASFEANMVLRYLAGLPVAVDMLNYLYFDSNGQLNHKKFAMPTRSD
ncbi:MAG TPA: ThiF family adenylyltransferase [Campylobacterales bacterium]|nr:ThiF family adenylyltransferase [Campylobacterales bacterium]